jgi:hypothetical protein
MTDVSSKVHFIKSRGDYSRELHVLSTRRRTYARPGLAPSFRERLTNSNVSEIDDCVISGNILKCHEQNPLLRGKNDGPEREAVGLPVETLHPMLAPFVKSDQAHICPETFWTWSPSKKQWYHEDEKTQIRIYFPVAFGQAQEPQCRDTTNRVGKRAQCCKKQMAMQPLKESRLSRLNRQNRLRKEDQN